MQTGIDAQFWGPGSKSRRRGVSPLLAVHGEGDVTRNDEVGLLLWGGTSDHVVDCAYRDAAPRTSQHLEKRIGRGASRFAIVNLVPRLRSLALGCTRGVLGGRARLSLAFFLRCQVFGEMGEAELFLLDEQTLRKFMWEPWCR